MVGAGCSWIRALDFLCEVGELAERHGGLFVTAGKPGKGREGRYRMEGTSPGVQGESSGRGWAEAEPKGAAAFRAWQFFPIPIDPAPSFWWCGWCAPLRVLCMWAGSPGGPVSA